MPGRRYSDGLHQALEAKEGVKIENENQTLATITFQNYFRMYKKLAGMTGTADTEAAEFKKIYNLDVVVVPTNQPMVRTDFPDVIYKTKREKFEAVAGRDRGAARKGQPVLVGTISIDISEQLSKKLKARGIPHEVLNAKHHEQEAQIVAQAGQKAAGDHLHQHGRPRHRHRARRGGGRPGRAAHPRHRAPRVAAASTTSCAAAPAGRGTRAPPASTSRSRTTCCASSAASALPASWRSSAWRRASPSSTA